jgi:hypothetical protein
MACVEDKRGAAPAKEVERDKPRSREGVGKGDDGPPGRTPRGVAEIGLSGEHRSPRREARLPHLVGCDRLGNPGHDPLGQRIQQRKQHRATLPRRRADASSTARAS